MSILHADKKLKVNEDFIAEWQKHKYLSKAATGVVL